MPTKQYVNLDPAKPDQLKGLDAKRAGKNIAFKAKLTKAKAGVTIMFEVKAGAGNVSASLDSGNFTPDQLRKLARRAAGGVALPGSMKRRVPTDAKGESTINLVLSECGGDEFTVKAYLPARKGSPEKVLESETFVVWRRLYFQVSRFKSGPKGNGRTGSLAEIPKLDWGPVIAEYEARNHNIELVDDSSTDLVTRRCNVLSAEEDFKKSAREGYDAKREPVTIRAVLVNMIEDPADETIDFDAVKEDVDYVKSTTSPLWEDESMDLKKDFIIEAKWRFKDEPTAAEKDIPLEYIERIDHFHMKLKFKDLPKRHLFDFWRKATIRIKARVSSGGANGVSWENTVWMANENMHIGKRSEAEKQQTTIHEVGHYIGMAAEGQATYYSDKDKIVANQKTGHTGPHCSTGLSATDLAKTSYVGMNGTCIMFGENAATRTPNFCTVCDPFVRTSSIPANRMPASW